MKNALQGIGAVVAVALVSTMVTLGIGKIDQINNAPVPPAVEVVQGEDTTSRDVQVGELVKLTAKGKIVVWECFPSTEDAVVYGENGENYVVSFRKVGRYLIVYAVYEGKELKLNSLTINVVGRDVPVTPPDDNDDQPTTTLPLAQDVLNWATEANMDKATAETLAANFNSIADKIDAGQLGTADEIIIATAEVNNSLDLSSSEAVMTSIQTYLVRASDSGSLTTPKQHSVVWRAIAEGFESYASR